MAVVHSGMIVKDAQRGGKLVDVPVPGGRGVSIRLYEDEALARGLLPARPKGRASASNKKRTTKENE